jgi:hypothetical protein
MNMSPAIQSKNYITKKSEITQKLIRRGRGRNDYKSDGYRIKHY